MLTETIVHHDKIEELAHKFSRLLLRDLGREAMLEVVKKNKPHKFVDTVCHSHDTIDANETMLEAFESVMGGEMAFCDGDPEGHETDLVNAAWSFAKASDFWVVYQNGFKDHDAAFDYIKPLMGDQFDPYGTTYHEALEWISGNRGSERREEVIAVLEEYLFGEPQK